MQEIHDLKKFVVSLTLVPKGGLFSNLPLETSHKQSVGQQERTDKASGRKPPCHDLDAWHIATQFHSDLSEQSLIAPIVPNNPETLRKIEVWFAVEK
jgi:hypothetical protein